MTQLQFEMICKIVENGAPALADELCGALDGLVKRHNFLQKEVERLSTETCDACDENPQYPVHEG